MSTNQIRPWDAEGDWLVEIRPGDGNFHASFWCDRKDHENYEPDGAGQGQTLDEAVMNAMRNADEEDGDEE